jgi:hypothetical protein
MDQCRAILLSLFCFVSVSSFADPGASDQVRQQLSDALRGQIKQWFVALYAKTPSPTAAPTEEQLDQRTDSLLQQALVHYDPVFTLPEETANRLLTKGPNDIDNGAAMKRNWEIYKKVALPLPDLMRRLHEQFEAGAISRGWDLELARRISDAHLTEVTNAQRRYEEAQKKTP